MSHLMTALAMQVKGLKPAAKIVLYWLADHHNAETDECFPSIKTLAEECEMSRRSVVNQLDELERLGIISKTERTRGNGSQTSNSYRLNFSEGYAKSAPPPMQNLHTPPMQNLHPHNLGNITLEELTINALFDEFWDAYPHRNGAKKGKQAALKAFQKAAKKTNPHEIIEGARRYQHDRQAIDGFSPDPATWLNQARWNDDIEPPKPARMAGQQNTSRGGQIDDLASIAVGRALRGEV